MNPEIKRELERARIALGFSDDIFRLLPEDESEQIYREAEAFFVNTPDRRWWWEDFRFSSTRAIFDKDQGWRFLTNIVPCKEENVWFIVGELSDLAYEATAAIIQEIIGECYYFEYYIIAKDLRWLLCETHHGVMLAIGEEVEQRLTKINGPSPNAKEGPIGRDETEAEDHF